jgi:hypothetical protein
MRAGPGVRNFHDGGIVVVERRDGRRVAARPKTPAPVFGAATADEGGGPVRRRRRRRRTEEIIGGAEG